MTSIYLGWNISLCTPITAGGRRRDAEIHGVSIGLFERVNVTLSWRNNISQPGGMRV